MGFNTITVGNKATLKTRIVAKQNLFKRFKKRFVNTINPTERRFCKAEGTRLVKELKVLAKQWNKFGFGTIGWITRGYKVSVFNGTVGTRKSFRKNSRRTTRKSYARKSTRKTSARRTRKNYSRKVRGTKTWSSRKNRSTKARRSYSWR